MDNFTELGNKELYRKLLSSDYEKRPYQREDLGEGMSLVHELRNSYWKPRYLMDSETGMAYEFMDGRNTLVTFTTAENGRYPPTQNGDIRSLFMLFTLMAMQN